MGRSRHTASTPSTVYYSFFCTARNREYYYLPDTDETVWAIPADHSCSSVTQPGYDEHRKNAWVQTSSASQIVSLLPPHGQTRARVCWKLMFLVCVTATVVANVFGTASLTWLETPLSSSRDPFEWLGYSREQTFKTISMLTETKLTTVPQNVNVVGESIECCTWMDISDDDATTNKAGSLFADQPVALDTKEEDVSRWSKIWSNVRRMKSSGNRIAKAVPVQNLANTFPSFLEVKECDGLESAVFDHKEVPKATKTKDVRLDNQDADAVQLEIFRTCKLPFAYVFRKRCRRQPVFPFAEDFISRMQ
jgi:hypothetical protein